MKLHLISAARGLILPRGDRPYRHDSPVFLELFKERIPGGGGRIVALDAAYLSEKNRDAIVASRRVPAIMPKKKNSVKGGGLSAKARMLEWYCNDRDGLWRHTASGDLIEAVFSSIKERIGTFARARLPGTQTAEQQLFARVLCYKCPSEFFSTTAVGGTGLR